MQKTITGILFLLGFIMLITNTSYAQNQRLIDRNLIGWYVYNGDHQVAKKWQVHTEYQWRRIDLIRTWQQSLARLGIAYNLQEKVKVAFGYTYFTTFPYGDYPVAGQGVPTHEHRTYQDLQWEDTITRLSLSHRLRLEQRWLSEMSEANPRQIASWAFQNRIRYQLQTQISLKGPTLDDKEFYLSFFDELFISFGKNVQANIFNQNRLFGGVGYQLNDQFQLELGYLNQITQHGEVDSFTGNRVFEINNGFRFTTYYNINFNGN